MENQIPINTVIELVQNVTVEYNRIKRGNRGRVVGHTVDGNLMVEFEDLTLFCQNATIPVEKVKVIECSDSM